MKKGAVIHAPVNVAGMQIILNFGGFYESAYEELIEEVINCECLDEDGERLPSPEIKVDTQRMHEYIVKTLIDIFNEEVGTDLVFVSLTNTDRLSAECKESDFIYVTRAVCRIPAIFNDFAERLTIAEHKNYREATCSNDSRLMQMMCTSLFSVHGELYDYTICNGIQGDRLRDGIRQFISVTSEG